MYEQRVYEGMRVGRWEVLHRMPKSYAMCRCLDCDAQKRIQTYAFLRGRVQCPSCESKRRKLPIQNPTKIKPRSMAGRYREIVERDERGKPLTARERLFMELYALRAVRCVDRCRRMNA